MPYAPVRTEVKSTEPTPLYNHFLTIILSYKEEFKAFSVDRGVSYNRQ